MKRSAGFMRAMNRARLAFAFLLCGLFVATVARAATAPRLTAGDKVVVISDILEGAGVEAIHVREVPALTAIAAALDTPDDEQDAP